MARKLVSFKSQRPIESSFFMEDIDSDVIISFHIILKQLMHAEKFTLDTVMEVLTKSLAQCTNVAVTPMLSHVGFRNLTPILNILKCLIVNSDFPWAPIFIQWKRLAVEMKEVVSCLKRKSVCYSHVVRNWASICYVGISLHPVVDFHRDYFLREVQRSRFGGLHSTRCLRQTGY